MHRILVWTTGFAALFFLWLLLAGEWNRTEWVAAAAAAAVCATVAEVARERLDAPAPPLEALTQVPTVVLGVFVDFGIVVWALVAGLARGSVVRGTFTAHVREDLRGDDAPAARRRAWAALAATYSPNAYVVEIQAEDGSVLLHDLVPKRSSEQPA